MNMQAIRIHEFGAPDNMKLEDLPLPVPGKGEVRVQILAASVNFLDVQHRRGDLLNQPYYQNEGIDMTLLLTIGSQGIGAVEALGEGVTHVATGTRVAFGGVGTYATHAIVPADRMVPIPDVVSTEQAAAGFFQGFVAYTLTHLAYPVKNGDWCLVQAAAGGIGQLVCQMSKLRGGKVIGVVSSENKVQAAQDTGADEVIISTQADIAAEAKRITGKGVNVVFDGVGKDTFEANLDSLAPHGYLMIYGQSSGYIPPFDLMRLQEKGSLFISRSSAGFYFDDFPQYLQDFVSWLQQGKLNIHIDGTYPLADAAKAHAAFEQRKLTGRVLLIP